jgi:hypothetical protein
VDTASTISSSTTHVTSHERDLLETLLYTQPEVVHDLVKTEIRMLDSRADVEEICAGVMRHKLTARTLYRRFHNCPIFAKLVVVRWCDVFATIRTSIAVESLTLSPMIKTVLGSAALSLTLNNLGGRKTRYSLPSVAKRCGEWVMSEHDIN